jgi:glycosyltransferase involved in cell wall biosynthesis
MKIIHIEDFFHPDAGYQINILSKYQAKAGNEVIIATSEMSDIPDRLKRFFGETDVQLRDEYFSKKFNVRIIRKATFGYFSGRAIYKPGFYKFVKSLKPDLLYVHGNDSVAGMYFTLFNRKLGFPVIFDNHMLEMATKNSFNKLFRWFYRKYFSRIIIRRRLVVIRIVYDDFVIKHLGIPEELSPVIPLGTDSMQFHPDEKARDNFRTKYSINKNSFVVLYMGKLTIDKGVMLLADAFLKKIPIDRECILVVVGNISSEYGSLVVEKLNKSENKILFFPTQKYSDLPQFYQMADLSVFPRHCSLSFFDAQASGLPVLLEDNNINRGRLTINNGLIFESENAKELRKGIIQFATKSNSELIEIKKSAIQFIENSGLDYSLISKQYDETFQKVIDRFHSPY